MNKKIVLYFSALLTFFSYFVFAENTISLQGRVLDKNGNPLNGDYSFIVRFCNSQVGGSIDFEREFEFVEVKDGFYSIEISTSASFDKEYWIEIGVKPQGSQGNYEFFPRYKLTSSPYAIRSKYSEYAKYTTGIVSTSAISMGGYPILDVSTMSVSFIISTSPATMPLVISTSVYIVGYASTTKFYGDGSNLTGVIDKECRLSTGTLKSQIDAVAISTGTLVTLSSTQTITAAKTFTSSVTIRNVLEAQQLFSRRFDLGSVSGSFTIDWSNGNIQSVTLTGNATLTFSNGQDGGKYILIIKQDSTGGRTITWPSNVRFPGGVQPTLTTTPSAVDYIGFIYNGTDGKYDCVAFIRDLK
jgi:hypothetical protein